MRRIASLLSLSLLACGHTSPAPVTAMSAVIVANHCAGLSKQDSMRAQQTMNELVNHCDTLPHGSATFRVMMYPDGTLSFAASGDGGAEELPMCVVSHRLTHQVKLKTECGMDVRIEETTISQ